MKHGMIEGVPTSKDAPSHFWKFLDRTHETTEMCTSSRLLLGGAGVPKRRSPEFLAGTSKALKFAATYFTPSTIKLGGLEDRIDLQEFCSAIVGPVSSRRQAFQPGPWAPPGFEPEAISRRVGKRMADALMSHYGILSDAAPKGPNLRRVSRSAARIKPEPLSDPRDSSGEEEEGCGPLAPQEGPITLKTEEDLTLMLPVSPKPLVASHSDIHTDLELSSPPSIFSCVLSSDRLTSYSFEGAAYCQCTPCELPCELQLGCDESLQEMSREPASWPAPCYCPGLYCKLMKVQA
jgi:hypothetical protein